MQRRFAPCSLVAFALSGSAALASGLDDDRTQVPALGTRVLDASFDSSFQDGREHAGVQRMLAQVAVTPHVLIAAGDPDTRGRVITCFDPANMPSDEVMDAVSQFMLASLSSRYQLASTSWSGVNNTPVTLTWSFVPDGLVIPPGVGEPAAPSELFTRMDALFGGNRALWIQQFESVFARWSTLTGLTYVRVQNGSNPWDDGASWGSSGAAARGDIRIGMKNIDGPSSVLAYNSFPTDGDMVIDRSENWGNANNTYRFLRNTLAHEMGHGLGLAHVCPQNGSKLMEPRLNTGFDGPQQDDLRGAHVRYGDALEPNNNPTTNQVTDLGTLASGATAIVGDIASPGVNNASLISVQDNDSDWFRFSLAASRLVTITITPVGSTYNDGPQAETCNSGDPTDARARGDLRFALHLGSGAPANLILERNDTPIGQAETFANVLLPAGTLFLRVSELGTSLGSQMYRLSVAVGSASFAPSASDGTFADKVRVTFPAVPGATEYRVWRNTVNTTGGVTTVATFAAPASGSTVTFDDTTAQPGQDYFYFVLVAQEGVTGLRLLNASNQGEPGSLAASPCDAIDFNNDGIFPDDLDVSSFLDVLGGSACATCNDVDFNNDGVFPDDADVQDFLFVLGGGAC